MSVHALTWMPEPMDLDYRLMISSSIKDHGLAVIGGCAGLRDDRNIVSYTCGLTERGLPEIVVGGMRQQTAHVILNMISTVLPASIGPDEDRIEFKDFANGYDAMLRRVPIAETNREVILKTVSYYGRAVDVMQLVLQDAGHLYPWEEGTDERHAAGQSPIVDWRNEAQR